MRRQTSGCVALDHAANLTEQHVVEDPYQNLLAAVLNQAVADYKRTTTEMRKDAESWDGVIVGPEEVLSDVLGHNDLEIYFRCVEGPRSVEDMKVGYLGRLGFAPEEARQMLADYVEPVTVDVVPRCDWCGGLLPKSRRRFCNLHCQGKWNGKHHGFRAEAK